MRSTFVILAGIGVLAAGAGVGFYRRAQVSQSPQTSEASRAAPKPTLYCDFYNFMHSSTVASFYFSVDPGAAGDAPKYSELYVVENEGQKTEFGGPDQPPAPQWSYAVEEETPTIASPDGATRIVLYGLKPKTGGVFWIEAGVRSIAYRNLEGKCRQANYVASTADTKH